MIFLIEYNRPSGKIVTSRTFGDTQRHIAQEMRLSLELDLNRSGIDHEVVLLDAENEAALRRTHRRYFEDIHGILSSTLDPGNGSGAQ